MVAFWAVVTELPVAVNVAVVAPAGTVTDGGTVTATPPAERVAVNALADEAVSVRVQVADEPAIMLDGEH